MFGGPEDSSTYVPEKICVKCGSTEIDRGMYLCNPCLDLATTPKIPRVRGSSDAIQKRFCDSRLAKKFDTAYDE